MPVILSSAAGNGGQPSLVRPDQRSHLGFSLVFQAVRDAEAIGQWAVLPQLPLAFEPMNRQPEPDDPPNEDLR
jgi:hypothetical protein